MQINKSDDERWRVCFQKCKRKCTLNCTSITFSRCIPVNKLRDSGQNIKQIKSVLNNFIWAPVNVSRESRISEIRLIIRSCRSCCGKDRGFETAANFRAEIKTGVTRHKRVPHYNTVLSAVDVQFPVDHNFCTDKMRRDHENILVRLFGYRKLWILFMQFFTVSPL